jgi:hypothetical protein
MKLTAKLLKKIIQEQVDELNPKAELMKRYKKLKEKSKKERLSPAESKEFLHIASVLDPVNYSMVQKEGEYHDMGGEDEMYNALDMPKRLSPKEIFGEFQNFVEVNNLSREDVEGMVEMLFSEVMDVPLNESPSMEHITPENIMMVINVLKDLGLLVAPAAGAALGISKMLDKTGKPEAPEK